MLELQDVDEDLPMTVPPRDGGYLLTHLALHFVGAARAHELTEVAFDHGWLGRVLDEARAHTTSSQNPPQYVVI